MPRPVNRSMTRLRRIEPMLLLHQERVRTVQIVLKQIGRLVQSLKRRTAGARTIPQT